MGLVFLYFQMGAVMKSSKILILLFSLGSFAGLVCMENKSVPRPERTDKNTENLGSFGQLPDEIILTIALQILDQTDSKKAYQDLVNLSKANTYIYKLIKSAETEKDSGAKIKKIKEETQKAVKALEVYVLEGQTKAVNGLEISFPQDIYEIKQSARSLVKEALREEDKDIQVLSPERLSLYTQIYIAAQFNYFVLFEKYISDLMSLEIREKNYKEYDKIFFTKLLEHVISRIYEHPKSENNVLKKAAGLLLKNGAKITTKVHEMANKNPEIKALITVANKKRLEKINEL